MSPRALAGRRVLVTRPAHQAESLARRLTEVGADVECLPTIRLRAPDDQTPLEWAAAAFGEFDWAVFTSVNGVERFLAVCREHELTPADYPDVRWAAIGPATARAIHGAGIPVVLLPASYRAEALAEAIREAIPTGTVAERPLEGQRILLARAAGARAVLPERLRFYGAEVDEVIAYVTETNAEVASVLTSPGNEWDWITFTASSAVRAFGELGGRIGDSRVAVIGPITAATATALGYPVHAVASEYTIPGLVRAMEEAEA